MLLGLWSYNECMQRRVDAKGRLIIDWDDVKAAARRGGRPTPDDVTVMSDGRRIDTADKLREVIAEFQHLTNASGARSARTEQ